jgi:predicted outer membrane protein
MNSVRRFLLACAGVLLLMPLAAAAQSEDQPQTPAPATESPAPKSDGEAAKEQVDEGEKRVCKSVRADPSSRRKTRVCRTAEEWRELNVPL